MKRYIWHIAWLSIIMTVGWQGLYFKHDFYLVAIGITVAGLTSILTRGSSPYFYLLVLGIIPLIPLLAGVAPHLVAEGFVRAITYLILFILLQTYGVKDYRLFYMTGIVITFWCYIQPNLDQERYGGVFEYANVTAAIVGAFFLFGLLQYVNEKQPKLSLFWLLPLLPMATLITLAASRGTLIALAITWSMALVILPRMQQLSFVIITVLHLLLISILPFPFVFLGSVLVLIAHWSILKLTWQPPKALFPILFGLMMSTLILHNWSAVKSVITGRNTATERFVHWCDGIALAQDSLWFGHGYRGFSREIVRFQSEPYRTIEAHNGYLDFLIDYGLIGSILILAIIGWLGYQIIKNWQPYYFAPLAFIVEVGVHSVLDFTLAYGFTGILLTYALYLIYTPPVVNSYQKIVMVFSVLLFASVIYITMTSVLAKEYDKKLVHVTDTKVYERTLQRAIQLDGYEPLYALKQLEYNVETYKKYKNKAYYTQLHEIAAAIEERFVTSPTVLLEIAMYLETVKSYEESERLVQQVIALDKYQEQAYALGIKLNVKQALESKEAVNVHLKLIRKYLVTIDSEQSLETNFKVNSRFRLTEEARYYLAILFLVIGDYERAKEQSELIMQSTYKAAVPYKNYAAAIAIVVCIQAGDLFSVDYLMRDYPAAIDYIQHYQTLIVEEGIN